jgi:sec-independent protein translocase protein TatA
MSAPVLLGFFNLGPQEMIIVLVVGVLLFGRRLPEMGRFLGKGIVEFKKGVQGVEYDIGQDTGPLAAISVPEPVRPPPSPRS